MSLFSINYEDLVKYKEVQTKLMFIINDYASKNDMYMGDIIGMKVFGYTLYATGVYRYYEGGHDSRSDIPITETKEIKINIEEYIKDMDL